MAEINEILSTETYLMAALQGNAALVALVGDRIYRGKAPESAPLPCVVFSFVSSLDRQAVAGHRIVTRPLYLVKAIGDGDSPLPTMAAATEIDRALNNAPGSSPTSGQYVIGCYRTELVNLHEVVNGVPYYHIGGQYQLMVHDIP